MSVVCQLPYPVSCTPVEVVDANGLLGGAFGNHGSDRIAMGLGPHRGQDFSAYYVDKLGLSRTYTAVCDGTVTSTTGWNPVLGWVIEVRDAEGYYWLYCHNLTVLVKIGQKVTRGVTKLGTMGRSGSAAAAVHLHLALSKTKNGGATGVVVDPVAHILARLPKPEEDTVASDEGSQTYSPKTPFALSPSEWRTWELNDKHYLSFVLGFDGLVDVDFAFRFGNLPFGTTVQARMAVVTVDAKGNPLSVQYTDVVELQGSGGDAFPSFGDKVAIKANQRLRLMLLAQAEGVVVKRVGISVLRFKKG